jgi:hypothetical protein
MHKFIVFIVFCGAVLLLAGCAPTPEMTAEHESWDACHEAQQYISAALKAPTTAEFPSCVHRDELTHIDRMGDKPGGYAVTTYVDAENSFGAKLRSYYACAVYLSDATHVQVQCLETDAEHKTTLKIF